MAEPKRKPDGTFNGSTGGGVGSQLPRSSGGRDWATVAVSDEDDSANVRPGATKTAAKPPTQREPSAASVAKKAEKAKAAKKARRKKARKARVAARDRLALKLAGKAVGKAKRAVKRGAKDVSENV